MLTDLMVLRAQMGGRVDLQAAGQFSCWFSAWRRRWGW